MVYKRAKYFSDTTTVLPSISCNDYSSIKMVENSISLNVYPIPFSDNLLLNASDFIEQVQIYSLNGEMLQRYDISAYSASLDVSDLPTGVYILYAACCM